MVISKDNVYEICQAEKESVVPTGAVAYHLRSHREYSAGSKLKTIDRHGEVLVCKRQFSVQLREVPLMLRRGEAGSCVHIVWCSLELGVSSIADIAAQLDRVESPLTFEEFEKKLQLSVKEALQRFEEYDLTTKTAQQAFESQAPKHISVMPGLKVEKCSIRRFLTERDYLEEKIKWFEFVRRLRQLSIDETIWKEEEESRLEPALAGIENETILALLTAEEKKLAAVKRLSKYIDLLMPTASVRVDKVPEPCPYPDCRVDLMLGQAFVCQRCENKMHAWHKSPKKPALCDKCYMEVATCRKRLGFLAGIVALMVILAFAFVQYGRLIKQKYIDPLSVHWYSFGQRFEDGVWHEFRVQDGITMYNGDQFRIAFVPNVDCYMYILSFNADGSVSQLFPNPVISQGNFCRRGQEYQVPDGINWYTLDEKTGTETVFLIASYDPLNDLSILLKKTSGEQEADAAIQAIRQQIKDVERLNQPDKKDIIRTRSGTTIRNVEIQPDTKAAHAILSNGEHIERAMEFIQGHAVVVKRVQFAHISRSELP